MDEKPSSDSASQKPPLQPPAKSASAEPHKENIKETIEAILVAFILAFVFRAFVVEAFVIPTGSMATTLLGAHMRFACEECGYTFDANYPARAVRSDDGSGSDDGLNIPGSTSMPFSVHCPNCGAKVDTENRPGQSQRVAVHYGDRILLLKYLYLLQDPARWDVIVFKSPFYPAHDPAPYSTNYIKRLTGLPGETLMLLDGNVYACPNNLADQTQRQCQAEQERLDAQRREQARNPKPGVVSPPRPLPLWVQRAPWQVQSKPRSVQDSLWRVIHDNDYYPQQRERKWAFPWKPVEGAGWKDINNPGRVLHFDNLAGLGRLALDKDANPGVYPFTDWLPYAETKDGYDRDAYSQELVPRWHVSDLRMRFVYTREKGEGALRVSLKKLDDVFTAEFLPGKASVTRQGADGKKQLIGEAAVEPLASGSLLVEFQNVDYQVSLRVNGRDLIRSTPQQYSPRLDRLLSLYDHEAFLASHASTKRRAEAAYGLSPAQVQEEARLVEPRAEISAENQICQVTHLGLWRDIYYTPKYFEGGFYPIEHGSPERPIRLASHADKKENEYFALGDNSIMSGDARSWKSSVNLMANENLYVDDGRVPERFLLGKAFFVYWPAGYRPFSVNSPGVIPNFGDMRFIH